jgi:hypothetical protein
LTVPLRAGGSYFKPIRAMPVVTAANWRAGGAFQPNMAAIDLLFNCVTGAPAGLLDSARPPVAPA